MSCYCKKCGGEMVGDAASIVRHCEFAKLDGKEVPDEGPIYCDYNPSEVDEANEALDSFMAYPEFLKNLREIEDQLLVNAYEEANTDFCLNQRNLSPYHFDNLFTPE